MAPSKPRLGSRGRGIFCPSQTSYAMAMAAATRHKSAKPTMMMLHSGSMRRCQKAPAVSAGPGLYARGEIQDNYTPRHNESGADWASKVWASMVTLDPLLSRVKLKKVYTHFFLHALSHVSEGRCLRSGDLRIRSAKW
jgi:hypothetical protein